MLLVLRDDGFDLREFPDLVSDGLGIGPREWTMTATADVWHAGNDGGAFLDGNESSLVFGMAGLTAVWTLGFGFGPNGFGVRMFGGRRLGRVGGILADFGFKFDDACVEKFDLSSLPLNDGTDRHGEGSQNVR
jgi:hypothetical protein